MKIGFIGTGKITSSIIYGIFKSKLKSSKIYISPRNQKIANKLNKKFRSVRIGKNNQTQKYNYGRYEEEDEIKRHTITELKTFCKMNGIKGYSKFDKLKIVQSLMKL